MSDSYSNNHSIILFDGVCNFCNYWVNYVMDRDKNDKYRFAALQSESGQKILIENGLSTDEFDTFVLIEEGKIHQRSTAALMIAKNVSGIYRIFYLFIILPAKFRDAVYNLIAKYRYKIFGKRDVCRVPTEEQRNKFLSIILIFFT